MVPVDHLVNRRVDCVGNSRRPQDRCRLGDEVDVKVERGALSHPRIMCVR